MAVCRLDKAISQFTSASRSSIKEDIKAGIVRINGEAALRPDVKIDTLKDIVTINSVRLDMSEFAYYMLNKPAGVLTATMDKKRETVLDLIDDKRKDMFPIGRLDIDTEGLLIISNDGELCHRLLSPKHHVDKVYYVETDVKIPAEAAKMFLNGVDLGDFTSMPARWRQESETSGYLTIQEGKFHQVKRMFEAVGCTVTYLKRMSMGPVTLDESLKKGEYRKLSEAEINELKKI